MSHPLGRMWEESIIRMRLREEYERQYLQVWKRAMVYGSAFAREIGWKFPDPSDMGE